MRVEPATDHLHAVEDAAALWQRLVRRCARLNRRDQRAELTRLLDGAASIATVYRTPRAADLVEPETAIEQCSAP